MAGAGFAVDNNSGGYAFKVDPDGNVKVGDESSDLLEITGTLSVNGPAVINEAGSTTGDFRVESNASENMLFVDASENRVGIGTGAPDYTLDVAGNIGADEYIYHNGDADTFIRFQDDSINLQAGGADFITLTEASQDEVVINENSTDIDFRVESNHHTHFFYTDGANSRIGIGTNSPQSVIHIVDPFDAYSGAERDAVIIMKSKKETGIKLIADSGNDNVDGENNNPFVDFYQDGQSDTSGRGQRVGSIALEGVAGATFTGSLANAFFMDCYVPNSPNAVRPLQLANDSKYNGHKARITLEGYNGYVGIHTNAPTTPLEIEGTTKSTEYATAVGTQDLGSGTSSTLSLDAGIMLLDADSINGTDMGGYEVHTLNIPNGSTSGQRLTIIAQSTTNSTTIMPAGSINGSFGSLSDAAGTTALEFVWISEGSISAWYQVS